MFGQLSLWCAAIAMVHLINSLHFFSARKFDIAKAEAMIRAVTQRLHLFAQCLPVSRPNEITSLNLAFSRSRARSGGANTEPIRSWRRGSRQRWWSSFGLVVFLGLIKKVIQSCTNCRKTSTRKVATRIFAQFHEVGVDYRCNRSRLTRFCLKKWWNVFENKT